MVFPEQQGIRLHDRLENQSMPLQPTAVIKARNFITDALKQGTWKQGDKLPSLAGLARLANVSRPSIWKAVSQLKKDKILQVKERGSILVPRAENDPAQTEKQYGRVWEKKRSIIMQDILEKRIGHDEALPSRAKLQAQYGVGYATLRKILDSLAEDRLLVPFKKSYAAAAPTAPGYRNRIVLILGAQPNNQIKLGSNRTAKLVDALESSCSRGRLSMQLHGFDEADANACINIKSGLGDPDSIAGFILDIWWWSVPEVRQRILDLIQMVAAFKKPITILDEIGDLSLPLPFSALPNVRVFRIAAESAGKIAAAHLLRLGHRQVAFFSYQHKHAWSQSRFRGLAQYYEKAGILSGVSTHFLDTVDSLGDLFLSLLKTDAKTFLHMHEKELTRTQQQDLLQSYTRVQSLDLLPDNSAVNRLRASVSIFPDLADTMTDTALYISVLNHLKSEASIAALMHYLDRVFDMALLKTKATAWVAADDHAAIAALKFLRAKAIDVPGQISVLGFDNSTPAIENRLTSFDFNMPLVVQQMLRSILHSDIKHGKLFHQYTEVEGMLIERETTSTINKD
jgi:DNA-binding LacI/PurR family transcriptional regulator/DNA-binding transcriptional regulator YhcF (GntR family)